MRRAWLLLLLAGCAHASRPPVLTPRLWLGGDVNLGAGRGALEPLQPLVAPLGAGAMNLEGPIADSQPEPARKKLFNAPSALPQLASLGVRAVGIANNHAQDTGADGPRRTAEAISRAGLAPFGGSTIAILQLGTLRVALTQHDLEHGVPANLATDLTSARARADVLVAMFHVTGPPSYLPTPDLRQAVDIALAAGAKVIAAHGTHAVGPLERRGDAVIAWGLGNVAFSCDCTDVRDAVLLGLQFDTSRVEVTVWPIDAGLKGAPARPSADPAGIFDLLEALGTPKLDRQGASATLP